jgi:gamma-glutamyltranspeptidase/glutathione hydrolase
MKETAARPDLRPAVLAVREYGCGPRPDLGPLATVPSRPAQRGPALAIGALLLAACAAPRDEAGVGSTVPVLSALPEGPSGFTAKPGWAYERMAVAAAHPLASDAGVQVLLAGGNALDAAIAVQMVLALVEPQSSGIGGGAFLMHWDGREVAAWDGRETAPAAADEKLFVQADGKPMAPAAAMVGGRAVGVPGVLRMLEAAHRAHGRLAWPRLFEPAIVLAEQGFRVGHRLHAQLQTESKAAAQLAKDAQARAYFYGADGAPHPVGHRLKNPALAAVLRAVAARGSAALHEGPVAADLVARVRGHAGNPGLMSAADLAGYTPLRRRPMCNDWRARWRVCGFPPPSSGHIAVMQILGVLERLPAAAAPLDGAVPSAEWLHLYTEAARLAFADRNQYVADPAFTAFTGVTGPPGSDGRPDWQRMLDAAYLDRRAALIGAQSMRTARPGQPFGGPAAQAAMPDQAEGGTSHVSVVDAEGRAVAMTTTIEAAFGARLMADGGTGLAGGYLLNNQLTDFSLAPADAEGRPVANRVQGGKRPRSSMSPTLVFDKASGALVMTLGSPGGAGIIHFTAKTLIAALDWGLDVQRAIDLPNFGSYNGPTVLETGRFSPATAAALRERGHVVIEADMTSGLQAIRRAPRGWYGGADPRREGVVAGR